MLNAAVEIKAAALEELDQMFKLIKDAKASHS